VQLSILFRQENNTYFIDRRWKQGNSEGGGAKYNVSNRLQSRAPPPTLRTTKSGSGSGKGYEKRPPCTSEHIKPPWRMNEREERDG
jgi:hypothetical protein